MEFHLEYRILQKIGSGAFGIVFRVEKNKPTNAEKEQTAIKILKIIRAHKTNEYDMRKEFNIQHNLDHKNILKVHKTWLEDLNENNIKIFENYLEFPSSDSEPIERLLFIESEFCDLGSLRDYMEIIWRSIETSRILFYQLADGVEYLHSKNVIHRDLKPENIMLKANNHLKCVQLKIGDFGLSNIVQSSMSIGVGTCGYRSPEMIISTHYNEKADVYSIGIIFYEMLLNSDALNPDIDINAQLAEIREKYVVTLRGMSYDEEIRLICKMVHENPYERLSTSEVTQKLKELTTHDENFICRIPSSHYKERFGDFVLVNNPSPGSVSIPLTRHMHLKRIELSGGYINLSHLQTELVNCSNVHEIKIMHVKPLSFNWKSPKPQLPKLQKYYYHEDSDPRLKNDRDFIAYCTEEKLGSVVVFSDIERIWNPSSMLTSVVLKLGKRTILQVERNFKKDEENCNVLLQYAVTFRLLQKLKYFTNISDLKLKSLSSNYMNQDDMNTIFQKLNRLSFSVTSDLFINFDFAKFQSLTSIFLCAEDSIYKPEIRIELIAQKHLRNLGLECFKILWGKPAEILELDELTLAECEFDSNNALIKYPCRSLKVLNILFDQSRRGEGNEHYPNFELLDYFFNSERKTLELNLFCFNWNVNSIDDKRCKKKLRHILDQDGEQNFKLFCGHDGKWKGKALQPRISYYDILGRVESHKAFSEYPVYGTNTNLDFQNVLMECSLLETSQEYVGPLSTSHINYNSEKKEYIVCGRQRNRNYSQFDGFRTLKRTILRNLEHISLNYVNNVNGRLLVSSLLECNNLIVLNFNKILMIDNFPEQTELYLPNLKEFRLVFDERIENIVTIHERFVTDSVRRYLFFNKSSFKGVLNRLDKIYFGAEFTKILEVERDHSHGGVTIKLSGLDAQTILDEMEINDSSNLETLAILLPSSPITRVITTSLRTLVLLLVDVDNVDMLAHQINSSSITKFYFEPTETKVTQIFNLAYLTKRMNAIGISSMTLSFGATSIRCKTLGFFNCIWKADWPDEVDRHFKNMEVEHLVLIGGPFCRIDCSFFREFFKETSWKIDKLSVKWFSRYPQQRLPGCSKIAESDLERAIFLSIGVDVEEISDFHIRRYARGSDDILEYWELNDEFTEQFDFFTAVGQNYLQGRSEIVCNYKPFETDQTKCVKLKYSPQHIQQRKWQILQ